jgi:hypothetical protein
VRSVCGVETRGKDQPLTGALPRSTLIIALQVQDGPRKQDMIAREISGDERAEWWKRAVAAYPPYAEYQEKITREIPVFVLEPAAP